MHNLPFETIGLVANDVQTLEDTYAILKEKFTVGLPCDFEVQLNKFDLFNNNPNVTVGGTLAITHPANNCYLVFIRIHFYFNSARATGDIVDYYKYQVWGLITSKKDYGRVLIRRETFTDKILGLVHPVELEFKDDKTFSNKFYVVTNDSDKALLAMNWNFRNAIMGIEEGDIVMEIVDNMIVIGDNKYLDADQTVYLAKVTSKIASVS